jgi:ATP-dependent Clp protease ATP-binding subunit ClpA
MFERFTEKAIKVIMLAQEEARRMGHNFVGSEQILLGLIGEGSGIASRALRGAGVTLPAARVEVERIIGRGDGYVAVEIPFTPRGKLLLERSWQASQQLNENIIDTQHLLLGLLMLDEGVAIRVLEVMNVNRDALRRIVKKAMGGAIVFDFPPEVMVPQTNTTTDPAFAFYDKLGTGLIGRMASVSYFHGLDNIGTESMVLGILGSKSDAYSILSDCNVDIGTARQALLKRLVPGAGKPEESLPFTDAAKAALEAAWNQTFTLRQSHVNPITILLGILDLADDPAAQTLRGTDEQLAALRAKLQEKAALTAVSTEEPDPTLADSIEAERSAYHSRMGATKLLQLGLVVAILALAWALATHH